MSKPDKILIRQNNCSVSQNITSLTHGCRYSRPLSTWISTDTSIRKFDISKGLQHMANA
uniref:Uncharacterized protein n=1 Tax=Arundo donax TaxID=35708 RepID=A0A0A9CBK0_ARUDO